MSNNGMWIFGYGSLVWQPGFAYDRREIARLDGYERSFCMWSIHHRGTPQKQGLVLALDAQPNAHCEGVAFHVASNDEEGVISYLRERELISSAYLEVKEDVILKNGETVNAITYIVDPDHVQYTGKLSLEKQADVIANAVGDRGPNSEYLFNVTKHLSELGLNDEDLDWLVGAVRAKLN